MSEAPHAPREGVAEFVRTQVAEVGGPLALWQSGLESESSVSENYLEQAVKSEFGKFLASHFGLLFDEPGRALALAAAQVMAEYWSEEVRRDTGKRPERTLVVPSDKYGYDVLLLDTTPTPRAMPMAFMQMDARGIERAVARLDPERSGRDQLFPPLGFGLAGAAAMVLAEFNRRPDLDSAFDPVSIMRDQKMTVVTAQMPNMEPLCVPHPSYAIEASTRMSTGGIFARGPDGALGLTACHHGTGPVGTAVYVDGREACVALASELQDTVFVPLPAGTNLPEMRGQAGVLRHRPPWASELVRYCGATSGERSTRVTSHDVGLPNGRRGRQLCVQTLPEVDAGDSGSALINDAGEVVGFAFQRTAWEEPIQFADWIWAASAMDALGLKPLGRNAT